MEEVDGYLQYLGGSAGALAITGVAAASAYYYASRPSPEKPLVPLDNQSPILEVSRNSYDKYFSFNFVVGGCTARLGDRWDNCFV